MRVRVLALVGTVVLAGCFARPAPDAATPITSDQLVGTWISAQDGGTITFRSDGTFTGTSLLNQIFDEQHRAGQPRDGSGTWRLTPSIDVSGGPLIRVELRFRTLTGEPLGFGTEMRSERQDDQTVLAFYIGDPDQHHRYVFTKQPN